MACSIEHYTRLTNHINQTGNTIHKQVGLGGKQFPIPESSSIKAWNRLGSVVIQPNRIRLRAKWLRVCLISRSLFACIFSSQVKSNYITSHSKHTSTRCILHNNLLLNSTQCIKRITRFNSYSKCLMILNNVFNL